MRLRMVLAFALGVIALPFVFLGLIDPLEGGLSLLLATIMGLAAWALSRVRPPRITWVSIVAALGLALLTLGLALVYSSTGGEEGMPNTLGVTLRVLIWVYRGAVVAAVVGGVMYIVAIAKELRAPRRPVVGSGPA